MGEIYRKSFSVMFSRIELSNVKNGAFSNGVK